MESVRELSIKALEKYVVVTLQIGYWSGEKKIDLQDIGQDDPGPLVTGLLRVDTAKDIAAEDRRARYILDRYSISFGPLKLVPEKSLDNLLKELDRIKGSFTIASERISYQYPAKLREVKKKYPHLADAIDKYFPDSIADRFYFKWNLLRIIPQTSDDTAALSQTLIDANIENLQDVKAWLTKIAGKGSINARTVKALQTAIDRAFDNQIVEDTDILAPARTLIYNGETVVNPALVNRAIETIDQGIEDLIDGTVKTEPKKDEPILIERGDV